MSFCLTGYGILLYESHYCSFRCHSKGFIKIFNESVIFTPSNIQYLLSDSILNAHRSQYCTD